MPGQDSFLDVVANIVGILILLVMVVGLRALREPQPVEGDTEAAASKGDLQEAVRATVTAQVDVRDLVRRAVLVQREALLREQERDQWTTLVTAVEQEIDDRRAKLDEEQQRDFDLRRQLRDAQLTLDNLNREQISLLSQAPEVEEIENLPTPLAQTVTGNEVHLRLAEGHVAFIPVEQLQEEVKQNLQNNMWRLADQNEVKMTVGPIDGFRLQYSLRKRSIAITNGSGVAQFGTTIQFGVLELLPLRSQLGEPVEQALLPNSDLQLRLKEFPPEFSTVTIWTYEDSFQEFRALRRALFELGYATAGRPMAEGRLIGWSPYGKKSAAQ